MKRRCATFPFHIVRSLVERNGIVLNDIGNVFLTRTVSVTIAVGYPYTTILEIHVACCVHTLGISNISWVHTLEISNISVAVSRQDSIPLHCNIYVYMCMMLNSDLNVHL